MDSEKANKIIATAAILTFAIGVANTVVKEKQWPSRRFLIGSAVVFTGLSGLAELEPDLAVPVSIAILTTVALGEGGGVLSYLSPKGEINTQKERTAKAQSSQNPATTPPRRSSQSASAAYQPPPVIPGLTHP